MKKIIIKNKKYLKFKIGDEFESITGKGSHNKMLESNVMVSKSENNSIFNIPIYTRTLKDDHIVGYGNIASKQFGTYFEGGPYIMYRILGQFTIILGFFYM